MAEQPNPNKDIGREIRDAVQTISLELRRSLGSVFADVPPQRPAGSAAPQSAPPPQPVKESTSAPVQGSADASAPADKAPQQRSQSANPYSYSYHYTYPTQPRKQKAPKVYRLGEGGSVFIGILGTIFTLVTASNVVPALAGGQFLIAFILLGVAGCSLLTACAGFSRTSFISRANAYFRTMGSRSSCTVQALAQSTQKDVKRVQKDLRRLAKKKMLGNYIYDDEAGMLFSDAEHYDDFCTENKLRRREEEEQKKKAEEPKTPADEIIESGNAFLIRLTQLETHIEEPEVLQQTAELRGRTQRLLNWLQKHPESHASLRRFARYYLPTVDKLLTTYNDVDAQADDNDVASDIQSSIVDSLHSVNAAFSKLESRLLKDTAMDVSSEISALETMLAQDGIIEDDELTMHIQ